jgi:YidC/Oxa1 family membrane protein insertase
VFGKIEQREEAKKVEEIERRAQNAPAPGVKPKRSKGAATPSPAVRDVTDPVDETESTAVEETVKGSEIIDDAPTTNGSKNGNPRSGTPNRAPRRTNNRPKKRRP